MITINLSILHFRKVQILVGLFFFILSIILIWYLIVMRPAQVEANRIAEEASLKMQEQQELLKALESITSPVSIPNIKPETNPIEGNISEVNPVVQANPFSGIYQNPFE